MLYKKRFFFPMEHYYLPPCLETYPSVPVVGAGEAGTVAVAGADIVAVAGVDIVAGVGVADIVVAGAGADTAVAVEGVVDLKTNSRNLTAQRHYDEDTVSGCKLHKCL